MTKRVTKEIREDLLLRVHLLRDLEAAAWKLDQKNISTLFMNFLCVSTLFLMHVYISFNVCNVFY